jgi:hypothetical protein
LWVVEIRRAALRVSEDNQPSRFTPPRLLFSGRLLRSGETHGESATTPRVGSVIASYSFDFRERLGGKIRPNRRDEPLFCFGFVKTKALRLKSHRPSRCP